MGHRPKPSRALWRRRSVLVASVTLIALVSACAPRKSADLRNRPAIGSTADVAQSSQYWGEKFDLNPGDEKAAYSYSRALAAQDQRAQAVAVLQKAVLANGASNFLRGELGKALAANGQFNEALSVLAQAHSPDRPDWRLLSAQGAVNDQIGRSEVAREHYRAALQIAPGEASVLSNLGLSYALTGDLPSAETYLRQATGTDKSDERARQNLAIVIGLQGRFPEAEALARQDLSPEQAEKNITLLRSMLSQTNTWDNIRKGAKSGDKSPALTGRVSTNGLQPSPLPANDKATTADPARQGPLSLLQRP